MPSDHVELVFSLVKRCKLEEVQQVVPRDFCWDILHPESKTTILVEACQFPVEGRSEQDILELIEWLVKSGASFSQKCGKSSSYSSYGRVSDEDAEDEEEPDIRVYHGGHSLLSYIEAWQEEFRDEEDFREESAFLVKVLKVLAKASSQHARSRVSIDEGIVEFWEKYLQTTSSHDLTIQTPDGCVTCHGKMLMGASPVVQAMLGSPMKEGQSQKINLEDTSSSAVQLFVEVLYTCSSQSNPIDWKTALSALDLSHRWQVEPVVAILADLLQELIAEENFAEIAEQAALKGLDQLTHRCRKFGTANANIQKQIKKGQLPKLVLRLFQADPPKARAAKKRKRL